MKNFIFKLDYAVSKFFHNIYLWGGKFSNGLMELISLIAEAGILFLLIGLILVLFKRTRKIGGTILCAVAIGFVLTNVVLKNVIARTRPFGDIDSDFYKWWLDAGAVHEGGYSFPSGHTTATTAFSIALFLSLKKKYSWPILFLPILMASSRIYLMVHYFSDCIGGIIVGTTSALIAYWIVKLIYSSKIKFFVWCKEFDIFKSKKVKSAPPANIATQNTSNDNEFVYTPQQDEQKEDNKVVKKETKNITDDNLLPK